MKVLGLLLSTMFVFSFGNLKFNFRPLQLDIAVDAYENKNKDLNSYLNALESNFTLSKDNKSTYYIYKEEREIKNKYETTTTNVEGSYKILFGSHTFMGIVDSYNEITSVMKINNITLEVTNNVVTNDVILNDEFNYVLNTTINGETTTTPFIPCVKEFNFDQRLFNASILNSKNYNGNFLNCDVISKSDTKTHIRVTEIKNVGSIEVKIISNYFFNSSYELMAINVLEFYSGKDVEGNYFYEQVKRKLLSSENSEDAFVGW